MNKVHAAIHTGNDVAKGVISRDKTQGKLIPATCAAA